MIYIELYGKPEASQACDILDILLHVCGLKTWSLRWHNPYLGPVACYCVCVCVLQSQQGGMFGLFGGASQSNAGHNIV